MRVALLSFIALLSIATLGVSRHSVAAQEAQPIPQAPQDTDWYVQVARPGRPVYMALPTFTVRGAAATESSDVLSTVVWTNLK